MVNYKQFKRNSSFEIELKYIFLYTRFYIDHLYYFRKNLKNIDSLSFFKKSIALLQFIYTLDPKHRNYFSLQLIYLLADFLPKKALFFCIFKESNYSFKWIL